ncbi:AraC-like DNA-binding protein [Haloferula luteola]|uniref:AraC-like DNA-binding protein n=1 Tax=Haloferula luteola TaxID=595692 RepID=A0A840V828_9BACT|nr:helix-turn-helix domain-containing protein [Haloferula luteola]MBB5351744.1 AraC-like DNA-binding protein [Haloferula luteola]
MRLAVVVSDAHLGSRREFCDAVRDAASGEPGVRVYELTPKSWRHLRGGGLEPLDGIIAWVGSNDEEMVDVWRSGIPVVHCGRGFEGRVPTIRADGGDELLGRFLEEFGAEAVAIVTSREADASHLRGPHFEKFSAVFSGVRIDPSLEKEALWSLAEEPELDAFLRSLPKPCLIQGVHDEMAVMIWKRSVMLGFQVPAEVAVCGWGDHAVGQAAAAGLSTVRMDVRRLGDEAVQYLMAHLRGRRLLDEAMEVRIPGLVSVIERRSTGGRMTPLREFAEIRRWLKAYPDGGVTVEAMIASSSIPRVRFYQAFMATFGTSPGKAIRHSKLAKAKRLLQSHELSMAEISNRCGFSAEGDFAKFFKREVGWGPAEWRRENSEIC